MNATDRQRLKILGILVVLLGITYLGWAADL